MLTLIFSSYNGASTLPRMLSALLRLEQPDGGWKIIAVDNASTDNTADILRSFGDRLPITFLQVNQRGKNHALNAALEYMEGELVVFTDDDVIPDPGWLRAFEMSARDHPDFDMFGGAIRLNWPRAPEPWILEHVPLGPVYAATDPSMTDGPIGAGLVWGPSMAIRASVFRAGLRFDARFGPDGTPTYMMGSETEFTSRLERLGHRARFCRGAVVEHIIRQNQMEEAWICQRAFRHGRSGFLRDHTPLPDIPRIFGIERWILTRLVSTWLRYAIAAIRGKQASRFRARYAYHYAKGFFVEAKRATRLA